MNNHSTTSLFDIHFYDRSKVELFELLHHHLEHERELWTIMTPNPEQVVQAQSEPRLVEAFSQSTINLPDGVGIVWAAKFLKKHSHLHQRISGREVVAELLKMSQQLHLKVLVIGGRDLKTKGQHLSFEWLEGYRDVQHPTSEEEALVIKTVQKLQPEIVLVAFGAPAQEQWILEHRALLEKSRVKLAMVVGGAFDYLLGKVPQVPDIIASFGLEWLFRLLTQPWRWRRQLRLVKFSFLVLMQKLMKIYPNSLRRS